MSDFKSLTDEVNLAPYAFVAPLGVDKGCYKHTVFWTFNIKLLSIGRYLSMDFFYP